MFRAKKGRISSGETFWLIPAIRRKERSGPGMVTWADAVAEGCVCAIVACPEAVRGKQRPTQVSTTAASKDMARAVRDFRQMRSKSVCIATPCLKLVAGL